MPNEKFNFTNAYEEIEKINQWFRREDIDLDEALKQYKKGMDLVKQCRAQLKEVENKFAEIKKEYEGGEQ